MKDVTFRECRLDFGDMHGSQLDGVRFEGACEMHAVSFAGATLRNCVLHVHDMEKVKFDRSR